MPSLYDLSAAYQEIQDYIARGEGFEGILQTLDDELEKKADSYAKVMRNNEAMIEAIKEEKKRLNERQKNLENGNNRLKSVLFDAMKETGKTKFKTDLFSFGIQKNGGNAPIVVDVETSLLPDDLVKIEEAPDLEAIRKYIEETGDVTYAHIGERGESLRIK